MTAPRPRPGILALTPYVGGDHRPPAGARLRANRAVRLASNENPLGAGKAAAAAYLAAGPELHRYPDGDSRALRDAIAAAERLQAAQIVCGAGSDELIQLLVKAYAGPGDEVLYTRHGFLIYPIAAKAAGATPVAAPERELTADVDALLERVTERTRMVFVANPNNPTGSLLSAAELRRLHAGLPRDVVFAIDSAYAEYVTEPGYEAGAALVDAAQNVVMLRTFSKIHGLAALRLGWAYGSPAVADVLNRVRGPFNVTAAAQAAGLAALADRAHVEASRRHNARLLPWFSDKLRGLGFTVAPSAGNFVLLRLADAAAAQSALEHLKTEGILVRAMGGYGLPESLRITVGTEEDLQAVIDSLAEWKEGR
jgi:histidinol-phosphate aminotransferase